MPRFDTPITASDQTLARVLNAGFPVALVVWREALDESLSAAMREVARADAGRLLVAKIDAGDNPQIAARASGPLPALILFRDGVEVGRAHSLTAAAFRAHVAHLLGRGPRPSGNGSKPSARADAPAEAPAAPITVSDATFQREVLESSLPVLVDLWAPWCGPCRMIAPVVEKLARDYAGRLKVAKLNVDENPQTALRYQVQGIPTLLLFKGGRVADRIVGAAPEPLLRDKVDAVLRG